MATYSLQSKLSKWQYIPCLNRNRTSEAKNEYQMGKKMEILWLNLWERDKYQISEVEWVTVKLDTITSMKYNSDFLSSLLIFIKYQQRSINQITKSNIQRSGLIPSVCAKPKKLEQYELQIMSHNFACFLFSSWWYTDPETFEKFTPSSKFPPLWCYELGKLALH